MIFISPKGESVEIGDHRYDEAISKGYKPAMEMVSPKGEAVIMPRERVKEAQSKGYKGKIESEAASEAQSRFIQAGKDIDPLTAGISGVISSVPLSDLIYGQEALSEQAWENQPVAYGTGKVAGIAGSMLTPVGAVKSLAGNIALGGAEGALQDKENRLRGAVIGGTLGGAFHVGGSAIQSGMQKVAPKLAGFAERRAFDTLDVGPNQRSYAIRTGENQKLGRKVLDEDLIGLTRKSDYEKAANLKLQAGSDIGQFDIEHPVDVTYSMLQSDIKKAAIPLLENPNTAGRGRALLAYADDLEEFKKIHPEVDIRNLDEGFKAWAKEKNIKLGKMQNAFDIRESMQETLPKQADLITPKKQLPSEKVSEELTGANETLLDKFAKESGLSKEQVKNYLETRKLLQDKASKTTGRYVEGEQVVPTEQLRKEKSQFAESFEQKGNTPKASSQLGKTLYSVHKGTMRKGIESKYGTEAANQFDKLNENYGMLKTILTAQEKNLGKKTEKFMGTRIPTAAIKILGTYANKLSALGFNKTAKALEQASKDESMMIRLIKGYPTLDALITAIEGE